MVPATWGKKLTTLEIRSLANFKFIRKIKLRKLKEDAVLLARDQIMTRP